MVHLRVKGGAACNEPRLLTTEDSLWQGRPTFFSRGPNLLFQNFGEPKIYRFFCQKVGEDQKKKGLRSDLISIFFQKVGEDQNKQKKNKKKGLRSDLISFFCQKVGEDPKNKKVFAQIWSVFSAKNKVILWYFSATHNVSAEASINQPTAGHFKTFGGPLLARGPRVGRPWFMATSQYIRVIVSTIKQCVFFLMIISLEAFLTTQGANLIPTITIIFLYSVTYHLYFALSTTTSNHPAHRAGRRGAPTIHARCARWSRTSLYTTSGEGRDRSAPPGFCERRDRIVRAGRALRERSVNPTECSA